MLNNERIRKAIVTGGAGGIGEAIANKFYREKIRVAQVDVIKPSSSADLFFKCDVRNRDEIASLYNWTMENLGLPDILVLNAGVGVKEKLSEGDPEKWQQVMDTNIMGPLRCIRAFLPQMLEKEDCHVVFVSSVAANQPHPYGGIYSASKTAIDDIAETLRLENINTLNVATISPGAVDTGFFANQLAGNSSLPFDYPLMDPREVAEEVFYIIGKNGSARINKIVLRPKGQAF